MIPTESTKCTSYAERVNLVLELIQAHLSLEDYRSGSRQSGLRLSPELTT